MSYAQRTLAFLLALVFLWSLCLAFPRPARALTLTELEQDAAVYYAAFNSDAAPLLTGSSEVSAQTIYKNAMALLKAFPDPKNLALWGVDVLFSALVPASDPNAAILDKMAQMIQQQQVLENKIDGLTNVVVLAAVANEINAYLKADAAGLLKTYYGALRKVDVDCTGHVITSDAAAVRRKEILTRSIPNISAPSSALCQFDEFTYSLGFFLPFPMPPASPPCPEPTCIPFTMNGKSAPINGSIWGMSPAPLSRIAPCPSI